MNLKNLLKKNLITNTTLFLFLLFLLIFYRDFLYDYRMALENTLGYWPYQNQIIFYETGNKDFDVTAPANLRFLGLVTQYIIFKTIPCFELVNVNVKPNLSFLGGNSQHLHPDYICATYSNSLMNYMSLCAILAITFSYCKKKLNLNFAESFLCVLISCAFLKHAEAFTLDRISILYFLITLYFIDKKYISIILVIFSCLVNEKIVFILCILFFIRFFLNKKKYLYLLISSCLSGILLVLIFLFYSKFLGHGYLGNDLENGLYNTAFTMDGLYRIYSMFLSPSGYSNTVMPLVFATLPYILTFFNKIDNFYFSKIEMLIPFLLLFFSLGGGMENGGRYIIYSMPLWTPIFSVHIFRFIKKLSDKI